MDGWVGGSITPSGQFFFIPACVTGIGWRSGRRRNFISFSIWLNEGLACMLIVVSFLKLYQVTGGMAEGELVY